MEVCHFHLEWHKLVSHNPQWEDFHGNPKSLAIVSTQVPLRWHFFNNGSVQRSEFTQIACKRFPFRHVEDEMR